ncbi:uncharacterized protein LOC125430741 [Sphaerodactylus townsendi]|uniref:Uncharacterized protein n=1 Tax=Sphaerodactylus townsendi TaxID=933632 RepID=A0ACB8FKN2_9SAUR|nr:uncharacterized protein LOC125430741 [Sphaerodactylus townsendi]XP_048348868.1 uncharacterized protein LOC125430741 [Sphaerodactylus townsendi]
MGRLDDHAKKRIVELRKAGLSFRKIKKVLELDNIRVTPQAIYLFLKRKNVEPSQLPASSLQLPALEKESKRVVTDQTGWEDDKLWNLLQENGGGQKQQREPGVHRTPCPTLGASMSCAGLSSDTDQSSPKIIHVTSLSKDMGQLAKPNATCGGLSTGPHLGPSAGGNCPVPQQASATISCLTPVTPVVPQHNLNGKGKVFLPPARNPAFIVKRKIVGRAIHLQKKANVQNGQTQSGSSPALPFMLRMQPASNSAERTPFAASARVGCATHTKEASTQTSSSNPTYSPTDPTSPWGGQMAASLVPIPAPQSLTEKLDAVHAEVQKLAQTMQAVLERQCRLERQQEQQQRTQQEVLVALQQLSSTVSQEALPGNQPCAPYGSLVDPSPPLLNFGQFKMELI